MQQENNNTKFEQRCKLLLLNENGTIPQPIKSQFNTIAWHIQKQLITKLQKENSNDTNFFSSKNPKKQDKQKRNLETTKLNKQQTNT